jgi:hypothetical protein
VWELAWGCSFSPGVLGRWGVGVGGLCFVVLLVVGVGVGRARANSSARAKAGIGRCGRECECYTLHVCSISPDFEFAIHNLIANS